MKYLLISIVLCQAYDDSEWPLPLLCDFGMVKVIERGADGNVIKYIPGAHIGKDGYNPPEVSEYGNNLHPPGIDPVKVDVFQLGVCFARALTLQRGICNSHYVYCSVSIRLQYYMKYLFFLSCLTLYLFWGGY